MEEAQQGKVVGVIVPPPDIRAVVDKTAQFVARNGKSFEERIMKSEEGMTPKFSFLKAFDPYHAYYEQKICETEDVISGKSEAKTEEVQASKAEAAEPAAKMLEQVVVAKASLVTPLARLAQMTSDEEPPAFEFTLTQPVGITAQDVDVIKLMAQYTAANGREFLSNIAQREQRNPQFDFLKPTSMLFNYFTSLVDQYTSVLQKNRSARTVQQQLLQKRQERMAVLEQAVLRWKWGHAEEEKKLLQGQEGNTEVAALLIDWTNFSIVETITFDDNDVQAGVVAATGVKPIHASSSSGVSAGVHGEPSDDEDADMDMEDDEEEEEGDIKIVENYQPTLGSKALVKPSMVDPLSGKAIDVNAVGEHMRVQLIDPRWRIEQQKFQDKQKETGFAAGDSISQNLERFAKNRSDIFGEEGEVIQPQNSTQAGPSGPATKKMKP